MNDISKQSELANFAWSVADLLRGDYKQSDYGKVILPFTVLRRLECVLQPTRDQVLDVYEQRKDSGMDPTKFLERAASRPSTTRASTPWRSWSRTTPTSPSI
ncbi:hypothetical protein GCM10022223_43390 [Kineosporia mesophila]|uniref:N6 adenine-specific DNA methyltransferase N-terminal domain-containing protein n=1 Tax=Kineosporia mesophila TaxID=566012 RepID=A0ABP6ZX00_9ACTN|nr:type I restriction-modification system subunit M N-terminal domain-containing protein [Kineosporia mesophila]MCD5353230.1 type I restriction-modification system subunit M N-terminal domain-containing protein [Kineosporia mesophila]